MLILYKEFIKEIYTVQYSQKGYLQSAYMKYLQVK